MDINVRQISTQTSDNECFPTHIKEEGLGK